MKQRTIKIWYWIITILFCAFMTFSAVSELLQTESAQKVMVDLGYPPYLNYILGIAKILGVIALLIPQFKVIKEWAYAGFAFDIIGAGLSIGFDGGGWMALTVLPFLVVMFISYSLWKKVEKQ
ncbi:MAG: hypothetical protein RL557_666 [archaeon]|jgi:uncharacterized membrane protein